MKTLLQNLSSIKVRSKAAMLVGVAAIGLTTAQAQLKSVVARGQNLPGEGIDKLNDGNAQSKWLDFSPTSWVQFNYDTSVVYNTYEITSGNDFPNRDPKDWYLLGSADTLNWDTLDFKTGQTWGRRFLAKKFTFSSSKSYKYYRWVITANDGGNIIQAAEFAFSFDPNPDLVPPTQPQNLAASNISFKKLWLKWTPSIDTNGVKQYEIYSGTTLIGITSDTAFYATGLTHAMQYTFSVVAVDSAGNMSLPSTSLTVSTKRDSLSPTRPAPLQVSNVSFRTLTLSWPVSTDSTGIRQYEVFSGRDLRTRTTSTTANVVGLSDSTTYSFYVVAYDSSGNTSISDTVTVTTLKDTTLVTSIFIMPADSMTIITVGDTLQFMAMVSPTTALDTTVSWAVINGTGTATIDSLGRLIATSVGTVQVKAIANDLSKLESSLFEVVIRDTITSVNDTQWLSQVQILPNPSTGLLFVNLPDSKPTHIDIYNEMGAKVYEQSQSETRVATIDLSDKLPGLYVMKIRLGNTVSSRKLILTK